MARAKVEVAYGRGELGDDRLRTLRDAQRRLRVALLALVFRRRERRERRGPEALTSDPGSPRDGRGPS